MIFSKDTHISKSEVEHIQGLIDNAVYRVNHSCSSASNQTSLPYSKDHKELNNDSISYHQKSIVEETSTGLPQTAVHNSNSSLSLFVDIEDDLGVNRTKALLKSSYINKEENQCRLPPPSSNRENTVLPPPDLLGSGNPFLIFMCLSLLLQHRDIIIKKGFDYNEVMFNRFH